MNGKRVGWAVIHRVTNVISFMLESGYPGFAVDADSRSQVKILRTRSDCLCALSGLA